MTARVDIASVNTWPLGPGSLRRSSQLKRRNPPMPIGASTLSLGPVMNPSRDMVMYSRMIAIGHALLPDRGAVRHDVAATGRGWVPTTPRPTATGRAPPGSSGRPHCSVVPEEPGVDDLRRLWPLIAFIAALTTCSPMPMGFWVIAPSIAPLRIASIWALPESNPTMVRPVLPLSWTP